ncbi:MAG: thioredoxin domain-containing protein [Pyrinomonadaceae bacterium]
MKKRNLPLLVIVLVFLVSLAAGAWLYRMASHADSKQKSPVAAPARQDLHMADGAHVTGPESAPILIEEFGDYQCPPCGKLYPDLNKIEDEYKNQARLVFRHFPITARHPNAMPAAQAAEAAGLQGKFWQMHDMLYQNQDAWKDEKDARSVFIKYAQDLGLDAARFQRDLDGPEVARRIADDDKRAQSLQVTGTPTVFINGHQLRPELTNEDGLRKGINLLLGKQEK